MAERKVSDLLLLMQTLSFLSFLSAHQLSVERKVSDLLLLMQTLSFLSAHQLSIFEALEHIVFCLLDFEGNTRTEPAHVLNMCFLLGMISLDALPRVCVRHSERFVFFDVGLFCSRFLSNLAIAERLSHLRRQKKKTLVGLL